MEKLELTAKYNEVKEIAKTLGIKFVGVKTLDLIEMVNAKIEETAKPARAVSKTLADYNLEEGQVVTITGRDKENRVILADRKVEISKVSKVDGYVKGFLINPKTNQPQKTLIAIPVEVILIDEEEKEVA